MATLGRRQASGVLRILFVEDNPADVELCCRELEKAGLPVEWERVQTPEEFVRRLRTGTYDLILSDFNLPQWDALAALEVMRSLGLTLPVILVSGSVGEDKAVTCIREGIFDFVLKDRLARLPVAVRQALAEQAARREKQEMTEALRATNQVLEAVLRASPAAIMSMDREGRVQWWNPAAERLFGWQENEVVGRPLPTIPAEFKSEYAGLQERLARGETIANLEARRERKNGTPVDVLMWAAPLYDAAGEVSGSMAILLDVSEQRRLQEELRHSQKMEAVGRLAGGVAHDFNNLLSVVLGYADLLLQASDLPERARARVEEVQRAAGRAADLTRQLLAFSRRQVLQPQVLDLNTVTVEMEGMLRRLIGEDIELVSRLEAIVHPVKADRGQVEQVIMNLVVNARDAILDGGRITLETANIIMSPEAAQRYEGAHAGPYVMLAVRDTGQGMDKETRARIFEPFFTTKDQGKGTGLGLPMVYGIVQQSGGFLMVESESGRGSAFKIFLPRAAGSELPAPPKGTVATVSTPESPPGAKTILLVEDEERLRALVRSLLEALGHTVLEACDGREALYLASAHTGRIDLLLTDVVMPGMSGRELAERLAARQAGLPVVYMSGYADQVIAHHGGLPSDIQFLKKPFTLDALSRALAGAFQGTSPEATRLV